MSDSAPQPRPLAELIDRLREAEIDWDAENIADLVWLSRYLDGETVQRSSSPERRASSTPLRRQNDTTAPIPPPPPEPEVGVYPEQPQRPRGASPQARKGVPFQAPTAPALRKTLALGRSLRPLMRKVDSYTQQVLDEEATAAQTAEQRFCMTVVRPAKERWLEVALVIEESATSVLWQETIRDFRQVLERQGAFRAITVWHLQTAQGEAKLLAKSPTGSRYPSPRSPKELIDASGRRLILLVSDCISAAWRRGVLHEACLAEWAAHGPLAIVQLLPGHLWGRTVLSAGLEVQLGAWMPGVSNQQLVFEEPPIGAEPKEPGGIKIPVVTLEPKSLTQWAKMMAGWGESWATGYWFDEGWQSLQLPPVAAAGSLTPEQLVQRFVTTGSREAKQLAGLMALVPVNLPIVYLLQETMLPESTPLHLAEIFISGLVEREHGQAEASSRDHQNTTYDFVPKVRELLMDSVPTTTKERVLNRVSEYIGKKLNRSIYSFTALLQLEQELGGAGGTDLLKFATLTKQVLQRMGGDYAALVETLDTSPGLGPTPPPKPGPTFPPLRTIEFIQAQVVDAEEAAESEPEGDLELFDFVVATLERQQSQQHQRQRRSLFGGLFSRGNNNRADESGSDWIITERQGQARQFVEVLRRPLTPDVDLEKVLEQRLGLFQILNALPGPQFEAVLFALNIPRGNVPSGNASQGSRVSALLEWAESPIGPGVSAIAETLRDIALAPVSDSRADLDLGLEMVYVPGGTFTMGSPEDELERASWEGPQHAVTVPSFFMGRYPVTQAQWRFVAGLAQVNQALAPDPSRFKGDTRPVEKVSWNDAVEFCLRLSRHSGQTYRLPTEAEWEYACRAGTTTPFHFGETITTDVVNYRGTDNKTGSTTYSGSYGAGPKGEYRKETTPVDHFGVANAFGLSDMHGNVYEWCQDHWHDSYEGAPEDGSAWLSDDEGAGQVIRGGSWLDIPRNCRSAYRVIFLSDARYTYIGFRVVCSAPRTLG